MRRSDRRASAHSDGESVDHALSRMRGAVMKALEITAHAACGADHSAPVVPLRPWDGPRNMQPRQHAASAAAIGDRSSRHRRRNRGPTIDRQQQIIGESQRKLRGRESECTSRDRGHCRARANRQRSDRRLTFSKKSLPSLWPFVRAVRRAVARGLSATMMRDSARSPRAVVRAVARAVVCAVACLLAGRKKRIRMSNAGWLSRFGVAFAKATARGGRRRGTVETRTQRWGARRK